MEAAAEDLAVDMVAAVDEAVAAAVIDVGLAYGHAMCSPLPGFSYNYNSPLI